jgi:hypothetical protein
LFPERTIVELDKRRLAPFAYETRTRAIALYANGSRLVLAPTGSGIDREWLYQLLGKRYSLPISGAPSLATLYS